MPSESRNVRFWEQGGHFLPVLFMERTGGQNGCEALTTVLLALFCASFLREMGSAQIFWEMVRYSLFAGQPCDLFAGGDIFIPPGSQMFRI